LGKATVLSRQARQNAPVSGSDQTTDPRLNELIADLRRARGETFPFLIWSGPLPPAGDGDEAPNHLFRDPWWLFTESGQLDEIEENWAVELLAWLFEHTMAYDTKLMADAEASEFAGRFLALLPNDRRWFSTGTERMSSQDPRPNPSDPLTDHTFDAGVVVVGGGRAWIAWFTDED
jgi:hypothetical protein